MKPHIYRNVSIYTKSLLDTDRPILELYKNRFLHTFQFLLQVIDTESVNTPFPPKRKVIEILNILKLGLNIFKQIVCLLLKIISVVKGKNQNLAESHCFFLNPQISLDELPGFLLFGLKVMSSLIFFMFLTAGKTIYKNFLVIFYFSGIFLTRVKGKKLKFHAL